MNAKKIYEKYGININQAIKKLSKIRISLPCWQLDDVHGFISTDNLSGGIASTGGYPYRARNFNELISDFDMAIKNIPGKLNINLHAIYESNNITDRRDITSSNYKSWIEYAKSRDLGIDFNPTIFSSDKIVDGLSLSSPIKNVRDYWIQHVKSCIKLSEDFTKETGVKSLMNIWLPDGIKEEPADRFGPRLRLKNSLDEVFKEPYNKNLVDISLESKLFGIGIESYTVGSHEFYLSYTLKNHLIPLLDMGHFHPTEKISDKISSLLLFNKKIALHLSRGVRWDSDHVVKLNDDLIQVTDEIIKNDAMKRCNIALDFFDASVNRVVALIIGARNTRKALLISLLTPWNLLKKAQDQGDHTKLLELEEEIKGLPINEVWNLYLKKENMPKDDEWYPNILKYEEEIMKKRGEN